MGLTHPNRFYGGVMTAIDSNRRMRENRTSGGVGEVTGAIPLPPPDQFYFIFFTFNKALDIHLVTPQQKHSNKNTQ